MRARAVLPATQPPRNLEARRREQPGRENDRVRAGRVQKAGELQQQRRRREDAQALAHHLGEPWLASAGKRKEQVQRTCTGEERARAAFFFTVPCISPTARREPMLRSLAAACGRGAAALLATPFQARWKGGGPGGVYKATRLTVIDNSGAKRIKVIDYFGKRPATLGSAVRASVKEAKPDGRVSRKEIVAAVIVRQRAVHTRKDGTTVRFQENAAVLMKRDLSGPVGTRVTGPVARELRAGKFLKVALMASRVI